MVAVLEFGPPHRGSTEEREEEREFEMSPGVNPNNKGHREQLSLRLSLELAGACHARAPLWGSNAINQILLSMKFLLLSLEVVSIETIQMFV